MQEYNNRSFLGTGSPYPTGKSPLVLDIEDNIKSIVQQQVENKKTEIKEQRLRVTENEKLMLDSLDMQTVEGMADKVALEFGTELDKLKDKHARIFYEKGGEFSTQDKLNLRKDQRNLEQKLKNAAADIKSMKEVQGQMAIQSQKDGKKGIFDFDKNLKWIEEYTKSDKAGSGQFLKGVAFAQPVFGEEFVSKYDDLVKNAAKSTDETIRVLNPTTGLYESRTTNKPTMAQTKEYLMSRPEFQPLIEQDPVKAEALVDDMVKANFLNKSEQGFSSVINRNDNNGKEKALDDAKQNNINYWNDYAEKILRHDTNTIETLKGRNLTGVGVPVDIRIENKNGKQELKIIGKSGIVSIPYPDPNKDDEVLDFKLRVINLGSAIPFTAKDAPFIKAKWDEPVETSGIKAPANLESLRKEIVSDSSTRKTIAEKIKNVLPDASVETSRIGDKVTIKYEGETKEFKVDDAGKEKMLKWINEKVNYEQQIQDKYYPKNGTPKPEPEPKNVIEKSKQELLDLGYSERQIDEAVKAGKLKLK